jgi:hypothetical protein
MPAHQHGRPASNVLYSLGISGNRTGLVEPVAGHATRSLSCTDERLYRLSTETILGSVTPGLISDAHDAVGNRLSRTSTVSGVSAQTFSDDANDRLLSHAYDNNGNTIGAQILRQDKPVATPRRDAATDQFTFDSYNGIRFPNIFTSTLMINAQRLLTMSN